ncbi:MAG TPA: EAL domain-containing protein [Xanthomonadaceae bacterium]|nr:EAL domain-containing protein [Xanthomonadaceae bacterium]
MGASTDFDGFGSGPQADPESRGDAPLGIPAWLWSLLVFVVGAGCTLWAASVQQDRMQAEHDKALVSVAEGAPAALRAELMDCVLMLRALQSLYLASRTVSPAEFSNIYENLRPREIFPSLQAVAYARRVRRAGGDHYVTELVAPLEGNRAIIGLVVNTQPGNLSALLRSRDTDQAAVSAPFRLDQSGSGEPPDGVTLRLPVYSPGSPPSDIAERRERMRGSLAVSFRAGDLIEQSLTEDARGQLHVIVSDVTGGAMVPLYDSHPGDHADEAGGYSFQHDLEFGGRTWRLRMHALGGAAAAGMAWGLLLPGLLASALLALLVWSVATTRRRALNLGWRMSRRYRESEERFRALNDLLPALVLLASSDDGQVTYANQAARARLGDAVTGMDLFVLFEDALLRNRLRTGGGECSNIEAVLCSASGDRFWASVSISQVQFGGRGKLLMVASDISEQRQLTELLSYQATHDALTELYNRREFERRVERTLSEIAAGAAHSALLYIDLDQFKLINDTSGHIAGDQLLTQLAVVMREQLRGGDVLARLGGDEFGVLTANVQDVEEAQQVAERLRERIDGYMFVWEQRSYAISASIGVVMIERPDITLRDLFAQADTACYMAKESGRNRVHFYSAEDDQTVQRRSEMEWANRLRWAVEENRLLLDYQELTPLAAGVHRGPHIELLLRLRDEDGRVVMPGAFIPAAERYGLMSMVDRWVIETVLANFDSLHGDGPDMELATINLSAASLEEPALAERILELMAEHDILPHRVCFEITETVAVRNLAQVTRFIGQLREAGCKIALDDFGSGMSSFGYLKNLPVDIIKIDGSFIRDLGTDAMSQSIVRAVTDIGHQRGLEVIAEWVTSTQTLDVLAEIGVDYAQGYVLHKPEPVLFQRSGLASCDDRRV